MILKRIIIFLLSLLPLIAENYEDKFYKDDSWHPSGLGFHSDVSYSSYLIEFHSSEIDTSIDYDILEYSLGVSFSYDDWIWGIYSKILIDEIESNMYILSSSERLKSLTNIEKHEFGIYTTYKLLQTRNSSWKLNLIYRESHFEAQDLLYGYHQYQSYFHYKTSDIGLSFLYAHHLTKNHQFFTSVGLLYAYSTVNISESIDGKLQDSYIHTKTSAIGNKLILGYSYHYSDKLTFNSRIDSWRFSFEKLKVDSRVGDILPKGTLEEKSFSTYVGFSLLF